MKLINRILSILKKVQKKYGYRIAVFEMNDVVSTERTDIMENKEWVLPTHIVAVGGIVINDMDEILMVKHWRQGWVFPGGMVEVGENLFDGLKREVMEETGVEIEVGELFCLSSNTGKYAGYNGVREIPTKLMPDFICRAVSGEPRPSEENSESMYVPKENVLDMITEPAIIERFKAYLEYSGRPIYMEYITQPEFVLKLKRTI